MGAFSLETTLWTYKYHGNHFLIKAFCELMRSEFLETVTFSLVWVLYCLNNPIYAKSRLNKK
jgi:hypothetical protein